MEIGPISAIRPVAKIGPSTTARDLSRVYEVEYLGQSRDDEYTPASGRARRGIEDETGEAAQEPSEETETVPGPAAGASKVSFFA